MNAARIVHVLLALVLLTNCGGAPARPHASRPVAHAAVSSAPPSRQSATAASQCDPNRLAVDGFTADEQVLTGAHSANPPVPARVWPEGIVRFALPAAWFPARRHDGGEVLYRVLTGNPDDVVAIHRGASPPLRPGSEGTFRMVHGALAVRGSLATDANGTHRLEAVGVLPCATNPYVTVWARTARPETLDAVIDLMRSLAIGTDEASSLRETNLDAARDRAALTRVLADPLAAELIDRALPNGVRARYPLTLDHPLADQLFAGHFAAVVGGAPAEVLVSLPVRAERAEVPPPFRGLHDVAMNRAFGDLLASGCTASAVRLAQDGVAIRCAPSRDLALVDDSAGATLWPDALRTLAQVHAAFVGWSEHPERVGGYPASLCGEGAWTVERVDGVAIARTEQCALAIEPGHAAIASASFTGPCAAIADAPWSETLRRAVRLDEIRGAGTGACNFTLGWSGRGGYVLVAGDGGTASAPLAAGPSVAVDRRAVSTAVAFVSDVQRYLEGRTDEMPANTLPSALAAAGLRSVSDPRARALSQRLRASGANGPGLAVLTARALDATRVLVRFLALEVEVTDAPQGRLISAIRVAAETPSPARGVRPAVSSGRPRTGR